MQDDVNSLRNDTKRLSVVELGRFIKADGSRGANECAAEMIAFNEP